MRDKSLKKKIALVLMLALLAPMSISKATNHKPTLAQIEAAKKGRSCKEEGGS